MISDFLAYLSQQRGNIDKVEAMMVYVTSFAGALIVFLFLTGLLLALYYIVRYGRQGHLRIAGNPVYAFLFFERS